MSIMGRSSGDGCSNSPAPWITQQDTILSTQIADLKVDKKHSGAVEETTQRGIFAQALDFLFAF